MPAREFERFRVPLRPPWWSRGGQSQTLFGYFLPTGATPLRDGERGATRRELELDDGDRLVVIDAPPLVLPAAELPLEGVVVHLFHGLTGSTDSNYMGLVSTALREGGAHVVGFNHRGQGPGEGLARSLYHSGSFPDMFASVVAARRIWPDSLHVGVGFSLSANTLLLGAALADLGDPRAVAGAPDAVLAVNPPVDLLTSVRRIESGVNRVYDQNFVRGMRRSLRERQARGWLDGTWEIPPGASVRGADGAVTAPLAGYGSAEEYYAACSSGPRLVHLRRPAALLTAADDPFLSPDDLPLPSDRGSLFVHVEETGGHLGYLSHSQGVERRWLGRAVRHYVEELTRALR